MPLTSSRPSPRSGSGDAMKPQVYLDPRPASYFEPFYRHAITRPPGPFYELARVLVTPFCLLLYRARAIDSRNVPPSGPVIIAPNHFSALDHFFCGIFLRRPVRFMAKSQLFKGPMAFILPRVGAFPVRRGNRDERSIETALQILDQGRPLVMYPEGGRSRSGLIGERARPGIGRLALESNAPVVPVAIHGSLRARNWRRLEFPRVTVRYGPPLRFSLREHPTTEDHQVVADRVLAAIRDLYAELKEELEGPAPGPPAPAHQDPAPPSPS